MTIGERLVKAREKKGVTCSRAAKDNGISQTSLWLYEHDERVPRDEVKVKLADYYKERVQNLFF